jgi:hypothetical protein
MPRKGEETKTAASKFFMNDQIETRRSGERKGLRGEKMDLPLGGTERFFL